MDYSIKASSFSGKSASIKIKDSVTNFGITAETNDALPNPVELLLGSLSACILKNVERFSGLMKFEYSTAEIIVSASRSENPTRINAISYKLTIYSQDHHLNCKLLKKNIEKFGTIYNTLKLSSEIIGTIEVIS